MRNVAFFDITLMLGVALTARNAKLTTAPAKISRRPSQLSDVRPKARHYFVISRMTGLSATAMETLVEEATAEPVALTYG